MSDESKTSLKPLVLSALIFSKENGVIIVVLSSLVGLSFLIWRFTLSPWSDFGLNMFAGSLCILVTVLLVDQLIKKQERRRLVPLKRAAFKDVQNFVDGLACFWRDVYNWSGKNELPPPPEPPSMREFLTMPYFNLIRARLNLNAEACVFPKRTWWQYLPQAENKF